MSDLFWGVGEYGVSGTKGQQTVDAFDRACELSYLPNLKFAQLAKGKEWNGNGVPEHGESVTFSIFNHLDPSVDELPASSDPDSINTDVTAKKVTMYERGGVIKKLKKLELATFNGSLNTDLATLVANNMGMSVDYLARAAFDAQTGSNYNEYVGQTTKAAITTSNIITADYVRGGTSVLNSRDTKGFTAKGNERGDSPEKYAVVMHPNVWHDLNKQTGSGSIRFPVENNISGYAGAIPSIFENAMIIVSTQAKRDYNAGVKTVNTTVDGVHAAGATTLKLTSGVGAVATGGTISITISGVKYTYLYTAVSTNDLTINKLIDIDGVRQYRKASSGLAVATAGGETAVEGADVYTTYFVGQQAIGYAVAEAPHIVVGETVDALKRIQPIGWYAYLGFGEVRTDSLYKIFSASSITRDI